MSLLNDSVRYDIIFDDDSKGEVADVVAIRRSGRSLLIDLYHCKYSGEHTPGARLGSLRDLRAGAEISTLS
jgi:hypothetical protein